MSDVYYETTTLYSLGRLLGLKYILESEGAYPRINLCFPGLGEFIRKKLESIDHALDQLNYMIQLSEPFYRYDRQILAEALTSRDADGLRIVTLLDFREKYQDPSQQLRGLLSPARDFIDALNGSQVEGLMADLYDLMLRLEGLTGTHISVRPDEQDCMSKESVAPH
jgi:hypothetical protein